ncbi:CDP-glucose 4,6-dehydratase [Massilia atriviolacea]|uniref:CDP-glucose 4,6-dehydratase n=1 Tax=Massilia atriviolacea TaxID=2495579 RepID=A0A430HJQ8_9BURK|nr:CDP-glucose 4,6-dehydratase [Massilia atriviolacea]RSZ57764.1 CDP-glucose 4,6-dehydratase [Massilia atriviolacea]
MDALARAFHGRRVFVTGHTGFKGAWLCLFLARLGARVTGYALAPSGTPSMFELARVGETLERHHLADVRDQAALTAAMAGAAPELVLHLAAQALVRHSYADPVATWSTNVMGTVHLLEAVRACPDVRAALVVTTDKCYENQDWPWGYRENDRLGGHDPYSASKAGAELVAHSYRSSFFAGGGPLIASARAGNVIGGGDWSADRLIPDAVRAMQQGGALPVRSPNATRPWQHVLEPLHGYLLLAARLLEGDATCAGPWNFGPDAADNLPVATLLNGLQAHWPQLAWRHDGAQHAAKEAALLYLDSSKARQQLGWQVRWPLPIGIERTAAWYAACARGSVDMRAFTEQQLDHFCA